MLPNKVPFLVSITFCTQKWFTLLLVLVNLSCLGDGTLRSGQSSSKPTVTNFFPASDETNVIRNTVMIVTFDHDIDPTTLTATTYFADAGAGAAPASITYSSSEKKATLIPTSSFPANTTITGQITTSVLDTAGVPLASEVSWSFQTGTAFDTTPPTFSGIVSATNNGDGTAKLSWSVASDNLTPASLITYLIYYSNDLNTVLGTASGKTSFTTSLTPPGTYTFTIRARDTAGNIDTNTATASANITVPSVSFSSSVQPIFTATCISAACHDAIAPQKGLNLKVGASYPNLVGVASQEKLDVLLVKPGAPLASYLYLKITGDASILGNSMPGGVAAPLTSTQITTIQNWILNGALNN